MKKRTKLLLTIAILAIVLVSLTGCGLVSREEAFDKFILNITGGRERYLPTDTPTINIVENKGEPKGYNVYEKFEDGAFVQRGRTSLNKTIPVTFTDLGMYYVKVAPVIGTIEQITMALTVEFEVVDNTDVDVESIFIKNNIVDLYYGTDDDSFALADLEITYTPTGATNRNLNYVPYENPNISIEAGVLTATGHTPGQQPYVLPIYSDDNNNAKANIYFRINNSRTKSALTQIYAGYVEQDYYNNDWVSFQCFAYAGMVEADGYAVYRKSGENYTKLIPNAGQLLLETREGLIFHKVKVTEPEGRMNLRFNPIIEGVESQVVYTEVSVELAEPTVVATSITLNETEKALLLDQSFTIIHDILPVDTYDKTVRYEIEEGFEDYLDISSLGEVSPSADYETLPEITEPITVKVISNSIETVFEEIEITIIGFYEEDIEVQITADTGFSGSDPLIQTIEELYDITFEIVGLSDYSSEWYLNGASQPATSSTFILGFNPIETAGANTVTVDITFEDSLGEPIYTVTREFIVVLESVFSIDPLLEDYQINEEIELEYTTALAGSTSVLWYLYTSSGSYVADITGNTYLLQTAGNYKFRAVFSHNGVPIEEKFSETINVVESITHEMHNVYVNGYYDGTNYAPHIKWFKLNEDTVFTVEIRMGTQTEVYVSDNPVFATQFTSDGFKVPYEDFELSDTFEYRIKTSISDRYTGFYNYQGTISNSYYPYLNDLSGVMNRYILNVYDLAKVLNYIQVFRPTSLYNSTTDRYNIDLYFAIDYEIDVDKAAYEREGAINPDMPGASTNILNASKLITAANRAYGAGIGMSIVYNDSSSGGVSIGLTLPAEDEIDQTMVQSSIENIIIYDQVYSDSPRGTANTTFPIDSVSNTIVVNTSNQLFLAASWGMRPVPTTGSPAESIYASAKEILNDLIDNTMNNMEKAHAIYDYLASEIAYDDALYDSYIAQMAAATTQQELVTINTTMRAYKSFHLEGVFEEGIAVCDGISKAFVLLCAIEDIPAMKLSGVADNGGGSAINHAWNTVMLEGKWYYVDATWGRWKNYHSSDDKNYVAVKNYYMTATENEMASHTFDGEAPIVSNEKEYYYFVGYDDDLYFDNETELDAAMTALQAEIGTATSNIYLQFVVDYTYSGELSDHVSGEMPAGSYSYTIVLKDNIVMIMIFV